MIGVQVQAGSALTGLRRLLDTVGPGGRRRFLEAAGHRMVMTEVPAVFREGGPGWPRPLMRNGEPLLDTGTLRRSISYRVTPTTVRIGTALKYARIHQFGGFIRPVNRKWLAIPLSPPLTISERRRGNPRDFPEAFFLLRGPEGPGLYRRSTRVTAVSRFSHGASRHAGGKKNSIERIFALRKSVRIRPRPFLKWTARAVNAIRGIWLDMLAKASS